MAIPERMGLCGNLQACGIPPVLPDAKPPPCQRGLWASPDFAPISSRCRSTRRQFTASFCSYGLRLFGLGKNGKDGFGAKENASQKGGVLESESAGQNLGLDHIGGVPQEPQKLLQLHRQTDGLGGDGHHGTAVGGDDGIDGHKVCVVVSEDG